MPFSSLTHIGMRAPAIIRLTALKAPAIMDNTFIKTNFVTAKIHLFFHKEYIYIKKRGTLITLPFVHRNHTVM